MTEKSKNDEKIRFQSRDYGIIGKKKEPAGSLSPGVPAKCADYLTGSTISISDLIWFVNYVYKSCKNRVRKRGCEKNLVLRMVSSRRKCSFADAMRLRRYHTRYRVIPYQACGLDKKIRQVEPCRIFCERVTKRSKNEVKVSKSTPG